MCVEEMLMIYEDICGEPLFVLHNYCLNLAKFWGEDRNCNQTIYGPNHVESLQKREHVQLLRESLGVVTMGHFGRFWPLTMGYLRRGSGFTMHLGCYGQGGGGGRW